MNGSLLPLISAPGNADLYHRVQHMAILTYPIEFTGTLQSTSNYVSKTVAIMLKILVISVRIE